jgi:ketosteroid isomerase-like protein
MKTRFYLTGILIFILFPLSAQTYLGKQKDIDQILENITKFSEYVVAADYDNIAASYTKDGKIFPNRLNIISGRADVRKYWVLPEGVRTIAHKITPVEIKVKGKEAYDYGYYEGTTRRANGEEVSWRGKYVIIWRKVGKEWKIYLDIWNGIDG